MSNNSLNPSTMTAALCREYGAPSVVKIGAVPMPSVGEFDVLVRTTHSTVSVADSRIRGLRMPTGFGWLARPLFGFFGPRNPILGTELAGEVVSVGSKVQKYRVGDRVFVFTGARMGCHATYKVIREDAGIRHIPARLSNQDAAALSFGGTTALYYLRDLAKLQAGERILILGASGAVGSAAVQIAKILGAHVTAICSSKRIDTVRALGADAIIDYQKQDPLQVTQQASQQNSQQDTQKYDVIFDTIGQWTFGQCAHLLRAQGRVLLSSANLPQMFRSMWEARNKIYKNNHQRVLFGTAPEDPKDLEQLRQWAEADLYKPLIDRVYPLAQIVEAYQYVDAGHKCGSVILQVA